MQVYSLSSIIVAVSIPGCWMKSFYGISVFLYAPLFVAPIILFSSCVHTKAIKELLGLFSFLKRECSA